MTLAIMTVADSIAALEVAGVRILDLDQVPDALTERDCPVLFPEPLNYVTEFSVERNSTGADLTEARKTAYYTLNYTFAYMPVGSGRTGLSRYDDMIRKLFAIIDQVILNSTITGLVDIEPQEMVELGPVPDPAGNQFLGARLRFRCMEFIN